MPVTRSTIAVQYRDHLSRPFPPRLRGMVIDGIDLVLLDSTIAGCVSTWLGRTHDLDPDRHRILRTSLDDVHRLVPALTDPTERRYYVALGDCAQAVLAAQLGPDAR